MARIRVLPPEVAHKIAAGEVIERPASVVKELVENSIDAAATQITVEIREGGLESIRVQDNGVGIAKDDLRLAFEPHATSKIASADDLFALSTLGFRGEALPSIASVAKLTLISRPNDQQAGYKLWHDEGELKIEPVGSPPGTTVEVRDLFYNVPARLKFLKSAGAERRRVVDLCTKLALAHPHVSLRLVAEGKTVLATPGSGRLLDAILMIEGSNIGPQLIKFQSQASWGQIQGYLGSPALAKGNRNGQVFIINGRVVANQTIRAALEKAYEGLLPSRSFPWAVLVLAIDPKLVDCNVHPAKAEVRFAQEQTMFTDVLQAVRSGLIGRNLAPSFSQPEPKTSRPAPKPAVQAQLRWEPETWEHMDQLLRRYRPQRKTPEQTGEPRTQPFQQVLGQVEQTAVREKPAQLEVRPKPEGLEDVRRFLREGRIIGQLQQSYILLEVPSGLWILDQHIVHERILLEQLQRDWEQSAVHIQEILPVHLEFTPAEATLVREAQKLLAELGLELEEFGSSSFLLRSVPSTLADQGGSWKGEILEIAESSRKTTGRREQALITLSCKGAVKAGQFLSEREMRALVDGLAAVENPFTCPHGRPIIVRLEEQELLKRFGRI